MAENLINEIKTVEEKAAASIREAKATASRRLNQATADAENALKEARQAAARNFRDKIQAAEGAAEVTAKGTVSEREAKAKAFYAKHKDKTTPTASWITEEVMVRYGNN